MDNICNFWRPVNSPKTSHATTPFLADVFRGIVSYSAAPKDSPSLLSGTDCNLPVSLTGRALLVPAPVSRCQMELRPCILDLIKFNKLRIFHCDKLKELTIDMLLEQPNTELEQRFHFSFNSSLCTRKNLCPTLIG